VEERHAGVERHAEHAFLVAEAAGPVARASVAQQHATATAASATNPSGGTILPRTHDNAKRLATATSSPTRHNCDTRHRARSPRHRPAGRGVAESVVAPPPEEHSGQSSVEINRRTRA
jgi:hypothetical protein